MAFQEIKRQKWSVNIKDGLEIGKNCIQTCFLDWHSQREMYFVKSLCAIFVHLFAINCMHVAKVKIINLSSKLDIGFIIVIESYFEEGQLDRDF